MQIFWFLMVAAFFLTPSLEAEETHVVKGPSPGTTYHYDCSGPVEYYKYKFLGQRDDLFMYTFDKGGEEKNSVRAKKWQLIAFINDWRFEWAANEVREVIAVEGDLTQLSKLKPEKERKGKFTYRHTNKGEDSSRTAEWTHNVKVTGKDKLPLDGAGEVDVYNITSRSEATIQDSSRTSISERTYAPKVGFYAGFTYKYLVNGEETYSEECRLNLEKSKNIPSR